MTTTAPDTGLPAGLVLAALTSASSATLLWLGTAGGFVLAGHDSNAPLAMLFVLGATYGLFVVATAVLAALCALVGRRMTTAAWAWVVLPLVLAAVSALVAF